MLNKNGYAIKEMIVLCLILAVVFAFAIAKVSFAFEEAQEKDRGNSLKDHAIQLAAEYYAKNHPEKFTNVETFLYGSELIEAGFLTDIEDFDYKNKKIKVLYDENNKTYQVEVMD